MHDLMFVVDIAGACSLRCPSCPVGNSPDIGNPQGFMSPELLDRVMRKATGECTVQMVMLFNWSEPFLHPQLPRLVEIVNSYGTPCWISSHLNITRNYDAVMAANPAWFRVSVSGFTQRVYAENHVRGDIERVKQNMIRLAEAKRRANSGTAMHVFYHKYLANLHEEEPMRRFATDLGFEFSSTWGYLFPLEKALAHLDPRLSDRPISAGDLAFIDKLALPLREVSAALERYRDRICWAQTAMMSMNHLAEVTLCCAVHDEGRFGLGNYLDHPVSRFLGAKEASPTCVACKSKGMHVYYSAAYNPEIAAEVDAVAHRHIARRNRRALWAGAGRRLSRLIPAALRAGGR